MHFEARLTTVWDRLRTSFWFLPSAMACTAIALSFGLVQLDVWLGIKVVREFGWFYTFGPEGARATLSAIASSMITVAGLTFSITMLTLQLASSQFGPRLLRNFMRDRGNQSVLGTFIATFVYCLLVLRTVRGTEESSFVPHISVAFGVLLAIASLAVLIYFIHHVAISIRIETVLAGLAAETREAIDRLYPDDIGQEPPASSGPQSHEAILEELRTSAGQIAAEQGGYVQRVDTDALIRIAAEHDLALLVIGRPGRFVVAGETIVRACPSKHLTDEAANELKRMVAIGADRTPHQDLEFSLRRIVEIAQRALSPGVNDPTTALYCIDRLGEALGRLAEREPPAPFRFDDSGRLRVITEVNTFDELACPAVAAVARYGMGDADVIRSILGMLEGLLGRASRTVRPRLAALRDAILSEARERLHSSFDRASVCKEATLVEGDRDHAIVE